MPLEAGAGRGRSHWKREAAPFSEPASRAGDDPRERKERNLVERKRTGRSARMENRPVFYPKLSSSSLNRGRPRRGSRLLSCSYQAFWVIRPTPIDFSRQDMASS